MAGFLCGIAQPRACSWSTSSQPDWRCFNPSQVGYKHFILLQRKKSIQGFNPSQVGYKHASSSPRPKSLNCFNPSQVGYKPDSAYEANEKAPCFNPSQVGYKPNPCSCRCDVSTSFNPSQVGYKPASILRHQLHLVLFQSLTGRLQTTLWARLSCQRISFQSLTGRLQTLSGIIGGIKAVQSFNPSQVGYKRAYG